MLVIIRYGLLATLLCICSWTDWKRRTISLPVLGIFAVGGLVLQMQRTTLAAGTSAWLSVQVSCV